MSATKSINEAFAARRAELLALRRANFGMVAAIMPDFGNRGRPWNGGWEAS